MPGFQQDRLQPGLAQAGVQPLRQGADLQPDPRQNQTSLLEALDQRIWLIGHLGLAYDAA